jgi:hypothetical protein
MHYRGIFKVDSIMLIQVWQEAQYLIFEVPTAFTMDIIVFLDVTLYNVFYSEDGVSTFLQNFGKGRLYMASDPEK